MGLALPDHLDGTFGIGRGRFEQRAFLDVTVDDFLLRGSEPRQRAFPRLERLEIELFIGPFEADHEHDGLPRLVRAYQAPNGRPRVALDQEIGFALSSWPGVSRPSMSLLLERSEDAEAGHDELPWNPDRRAAC
jgi:hypothetical protein